MDEEMRKAREEEIRQQIKDLQEELTELRIVPITKLVTESPYDSYMKAKPTTPTNSDAWKDLLTLGRRIWSKPGQNIPNYKTMTKVQVELSAEMLNEMIPVYNKYWEKARAEEWRKSR